MTTRRRKTRRLRGGSIPPPPSTVISQSAYDLIESPSKRNLIDKIKDVNTSLRANHTISNYLKRKGWGKLGRFASFFGYGRRPRRRATTTRRRRPLRGGMIPMILPPRGLRLLGGRRRRTTTRRRTLRGRGIFGDIWNGIKDVGKTIGGAVLPVAGGLAKDLLVQKLTGGRRRRRAAPRRRLRGRGILGSLLGNLIPI